MSTRISRHAMVVAFFLCGFVHASADGRGDAGSGGTPLSRGGGEPGRIFQANLAATRTGDVDALLSTVIKMQADIMREQRNSPAFVNLVEGNKANALTDVVVSGGQDYGNKATLEFTAKTPEDDTVTGRVDLVKEGDGWKVKQVSLGGN